MKHTIGYGHYGADVKKNMTITQAEADALLVKDLEKFEKHVTNCAVKKFPGLNENQFSSLVSYCYNRGLGGLKELVNNSDSISSMGNNIVVYWGSNAIYKDALLKRRKKEQALFNTPIETVTENKKSVDEVAKEVINGLWGNGADRKDRLTKAGYNYKEVQARVNALLSKPIMPTYPPQLKRGSRGVQVERLQKVLNYLIDTKLPVTGFFGDMTYYALIEYQKKNNLFVDGVFGRFTYESMRSKL